MSNEMHQAFTTDIHSQGRSDRELMFKCHGCGDDSHYTSFSADFDLLEENKVYVSVYVGDEYKQPKGFIGRIKAAYKLFKEGEYHRAESGLDREDLQQIRSFIDEVIHTSDANNKVIDSSLR